MILGVLAVILMATTIVVWTFSFFDSLLGLLLYFDISKNWALCLIFLLIALTQSITIKNKDKERLYQLLPRFYRKLLYVFSIIVVTYWVWLEQPYSIGWIIAFIFVSLVLVVGSIYTMVKEYRKSDSIIQD